MNKLLFKLENIIQNYAWGSHDSLTKLFQIPNPNNEPQAEIWMGTHINGCSKIKDTKQLLSELIVQDKQSYIGDYTLERFGELPFLFKVLAARTPLSIQVHPSKQNAKIGFARENAKAIALDAANRNYKDPNHKPELVYALTFYKAMNGFRPIEQIIKLFSQAQIITLAGELNDLITNANEQGLKKFFTAIMSLTGNKKEQALKELQASIQKMPQTALAREANSYIQNFMQYYADDIGLFAPFILNTIELAPGEAMYLDAQTPHAYVEGSALEIMASSDNVLRAGLTPKFIDTKELIDNTLFKVTDPKNITLTPMVKENKLSFPVPVDDFAFDIINVLEQKTEQFVRSGEILFCINGKVQIKSDHEEVTLIAGESVFVSYIAKKYTYSGSGRLARAYN